MNEFNYFYYEDGSYCYTGTNVLRNKMNIRDSIEFEKAERIISYARMVELDESPV